MPDGTRSRTVEVHEHAAQVRIIEGGELVAAHPLPADGSRRSLDPAHRRRPPRAGEPLPDGPEPGPAARPLDFYDAVGQRLACAGRASP